MFFYMACVVALIIRALQRFIFPADEFKHLNQLTDVHKMQLRASLRTEFWVRSMELMTGCQFFYDTVYTQESEVNVSVAQWSSEGKFVMSTLIFKLSHSAFALGVFGYQRTRQYCGSNADDSTVIDSKYLLNGFSLKDSRWLTMFVLNSTIALSYQHSWRALAQTLQKY